MMHSMQVLAAAREDPSLAAHLTWPRRLTMAAEAAAGMFYLHSRPVPIVHRGGALVWSCPQVSEHGRRPGWHRGGEHGDATGEVGWVGGKAGDGRAWHVYLP